VSRSLGRRLLAFGGAWLLMVTLALALADHPAQAADKPAEKSVAEKLAQQGALLPRDSKDAGAFRGGLVYANYCVTCHGFNADGNGRAARLYNPRPANLRMSDKNDAYMGLIIRLGGEAMGRSPFMPPWGAELTDEQMGDLVTYLRAINARGKEQGE
jgi:mono/diheme cytochrome c family protein